MVRHAAMARTGFVAALAVASVLGYAVRLGAAEDKVAAEGPFQPTWESLEKYQAPDWFLDGKFGIFVHWGPQTLAGAKDGSADGSKTGNWKDYAVAFRGEKFDAAHWAEMFRKSGAKYVVQVAEHHDGYALYDSSLTPRTSVKMAPKPTPV